MKSLIQIAHRHELASLPDEDLVRLLYAQFGPEIDRLKRAPPAVEGGESQSHSKGYLTADGLSPSRLLFNENFDEVNRSITNIRALKWVLADDYDAFAANQPSPVKSSQVTFQSLNRQVDFFLKDTDRLFASIVALIIGDKGKDPYLADEIYARKGTKSECADRKNHDELLAEAVACGILDGSLSQLTDPSAQI
ncbi:hypothetical protein N7520_005693 [Penicillium odoratum]|uniref:uncharacterized protein n=1 Tax=Penicillium odoratum TaxID=1167516 RepID=UPI0025479AEF|nr:uncharacterized protein N7520_005693 [Penicillium odoratum]KAJ5758537.1 hypothetical protein N7520_005693 [Penicillium odoratum]